MSISKEIQEKGLGECKYIRMIPYPKPPLSLSLSLSHFMRVNVLNTVSQCELANILLAL